MEEHIQDKDIIDVAIIGGGVSGAYTAYRLLHVDAGKSSFVRDLLDRTGRDQLDVHLFEGSPRIGGRLWTLTDYYPDFSLPIELGGMCFARLSQSVYRLCRDELGFADQLKPCGIYNNPPTLQYMRGHRFTVPQYEKPESPPKPIGKLPPGQYGDAQWRNKIYQEGLRTYYPEVVPYFLKGNERWKTPTALLFEALDNSLTQPKQKHEFQQRRKDIAQLLSQKEISKALSEIYDLFEFLNHAKRQGLFLYQYGFWDFLLEMMSHEAYQALSQFTFSTSYYTYGNLYNMIVLFLQGSFCGALNDPPDYYPYYKLGGGFDQLPKKLVEPLEQQGKVHRGHWLHELQYVHHRDEKLVAMTLKDTSGRPVVKYARYVVLAMPQRALTLLSRDSVIFKSTQFLKDINTVDGIPAIKLFLIYDEPWWKDVPGLDIRSSWSATDLPIRACYYMGADPKTQKALLLASINDALSTQYWMGFLETAFYGPTGTLFGNPLENVSADHHTLTLSEPEHMVDRMVEATQKQLKAVHDYEVPEPCELPIFRNWTLDPYGGGWHSWNPNVDCWEVMPRIRKLSVSDPHPRIFLCGEAYSLQQGWVEGAINTAERVLEDYFDLPRPGWVDEGYHFGP